MIRAPAGRALLVAAALVSLAVTTVGVTLLGREAATAAGATTVDPSPP